MKIARRPRLALSVAAVGFALTASGCAYFNPVQTHGFYQAADGTNANPTGVGVRNAILIVDAQGHGNVWTTVTNETSETSIAQLEGTFEGSVVFSASVEVPAGGVTPIGGEGEQLITASEVPAPAGSVMQLTVTAPGQEPTTITIPVQDDALGYYPTAHTSTSPSDGGQG
ncbi:hypothetical protein ACT3TZ_07990 [Brachybacterium sp. AOP25-B2-12]|uniref:hypothetical protein n=1 Tax=Brachybacterium sp. AOP25-B2-12 TaxID=3457710 RepID=UPI0040347953